MVCELITSPPAPVDSPTNPRHTSQNPSQPERLLQRLEKAAVCPQTQATTTRGAGSARVSSEALKRVQPPRPGSQALSCELASPSETR
eukprot:3494514-Rhodomonas_salina.1